MLAVTWLDGDLVEHFGFSTTLQLALAAEWTLEAARIRCTPAKTKRVAGESRHGDCEYKELF